MPRALAKTSRYLQERSAQAQLNPLEPITALYCWSNTTP
eukprot:CAMPEP_0184288852 /NCGR_PEP_ID=MMETSP1049-20130417/1339_1 /TAXON_ID=77928 /ORGANISM="Proteomonas sulcata, Strain CCMP704" /LENGTH=38 /DNA_ID= /DNA_START= /DNA_END= /DNA_ORIENTATION=